MEIVLCPLLFPLLTLTVERFLMLLKTVGMFTMAGLARLCK